MEIAPSFVDAHTTLCQLVCRFESVNDSRQSIFTKLTFEMFVGQGSPCKLKHLLILMFAIDLFDRQTLAHDQRWVSFVSLLIDSINLICIEVVFQIWTTVALGLAIAV